MVSTFTPFINLEEPARGDYVGTWDLPVNGNSTILDLVGGGTATIGLNNTPVTLASSQFQCNTIVFNSTLTGNVAITFPTSFKKPYTVANLCTGFSFNVTLQTTAAGGQVIAIPQGEYVDILNDGTNIKFRNLGRVGTYIDYAVTGVPGWISNCTVPPYLNCDGSTFSSSTYPVLAAVLGGTTLPDARGRHRFSLNQGSSRITSAGAGIDGNTLLATGGTDGITLSSSQIPTLTSSGNNTIQFAGALAYPTGGAPVTAVTVNNGTGVAYVVPYNNTTANWAGSSSVTTNISVTYTNGSQANLKSNIPGYVGGLTLIRAG